MHEHYLQEVGTRDPRTNTVRFSRTYVPAHATDIRITFARLKAQKQLDALRMTMQIEEWMKEESCVAGLKSE
jgi:hypothetical protein